MLDQLRIVDGIEDEIVLLGHGVSPQTSDLAVNGWR